MVLIINLIIIIEHIFMKILLISTAKPYKGSGSGLTEYAYQLITHMEQSLSKNDSVEELYALGASKRNNILGLIKTNTSFKKKIAAIPKDKYDIIHITDHEIGFAAKILKKNWQQREGHYYCARPLKI
jgi:hypothetical protein